MKYYFCNIRKWLLSIYKLRRCACRTMTNEYIAPAVFIGCDKLCDKTFLGTDRSLLSTEKTVEVPVAIPVRTSESSNSSSLSSSPQRQRSSKKEKSASSDVQLALKRQFEDKFVLSEESYQPHTLKVKSWKKRELKAVKKAVVKQEEAVKETPRRKPSRLDHPAVEEEVDIEEEEEEDSMEDEQEETIELKLGYEFIRVLEEEFGSGGTGNDNFQPPDGLFPVIQIRKSMAQELHALWVESMERQLSFMHEQLDAMIARGWLNYF